LVEHFVVETRKHEKQLNESKMAQHKNSSFNVAELLSPTNGVRGALQKKGVEPKDHHKENLRAIRDAQKQNREKKVEVELKSSSQKQFKMKQFQNVESVVSQKMSQQQQQPDLPRTPSREFLRAHSKTEDPRLATISNPASPRSPRVRAKDPIPKDSGKLLPRTEKDFIAGNAIEVIRTRPKEHLSSQKELPTAHDVNPEYGRVPQYLQHRLDEKRNEEEERRRLAEERQGCPEGMVKMADNERLESLRILQENKAKLEKEMCNLPLVIDTPTLRRRKEDMETKAREIEDAIKVFSKSVVFMSVDQ